MKRSPIPKKRKTLRRGRLIDKDYKAYIAEQACLLCDRWFGSQQETRTEVAHVGTRGLGQKCSDRETIPLCSDHHRTSASSIHALGRKEFERQHKIDINDAIARYNAEYEDQHA